MLAQIAALVCPWQASGDVQDKLISFGAIEVKIKRTDNKELVHSVDFQGSQFLHDNLKQLITELEGVETLKASFTALTDADVRVLSLLPQLTELDISMTEATKECITILRDKKRKSLRSLAIIAMPLDEPALVKLSEFEALQSLSIGDASITDKSLKSIAGMRLKRLAVYSSQITANGLKDLPVKGGLTDLCLFGCPIGDEGVANLKELKSLNTIDLRCTAISDRGLGILSGMTSLKRVLIGGNELSETALDALQRTSPTLIVVRDLFPRD